MRKLLALILALAMMLSLAACGGGSASDGTNLKVFIFANDHESEIYKKMIDQFQQTHDDVDNIEVQITTKDEYNTTLTGMMTAGDLPDVFYVGPETLEQYVKNGYILDMSPVMDQLGIDTSDLMQDILNAYRYDGTATGAGDIYAVPKDASVFAYAYNKQLFDEAGLPYPDPNKPYTYDEFVEVCQKLTLDKDGDGEIDQWGCGFANAFMLYQFIWSNGASFLSDDYRTVTIDTPEFKDAVQKFVDLTLKYKVTPTVEQDASLGVYQRWLAGQEAFYAAGTWDVAAFMDSETFPYEWDLCAYPTLSTGKSMTWLGTVGYCVSAKSEHPEQAVALANYLSTDPEGQRTVSGITTGESIQLPNIVSLAEGEFVDAVKNGSLPYPQNVEVMFNYMNGSDTCTGRFMETNYTPNGEWADIFFNGLDNVKNGSMTVDEYVASVQGEMQDALDNAWASVE